MQRTCRSLFANRFTALVDACTLVSSLKRNLLLTLRRRNFSVSAGGVVFSMRPKLPSKRFCTRRIQPNARKVHAPADFPGGRTPTRKSEKAIFLTGHKPGHRDPVATVM